MEVTTAPPDVEFDLSDRFIVIMLYLILLGRVEFQVRYSVLLGCTVVSVRFYWMELFTFKSRTVGNGGGN